MIGALSLISFSSIASNANQFTYGGVSIQTNSYDNINFAPNIDTSNLSPLKLTTSSSASGYRGFVGHQFNQYIAIEGGISTLGEAEFSVIEETTDAKGVKKTKVLHSGGFETSTADIRAMGTYPISETLFLKAHVGALLWDNDFNYLAGEIDNLTVEKSSDNGVSLLTGVGIGYGFNNKVAISLDYEKTTIADIDTSNLAFSLIIRI
jgi:hypothetical protein